MDQPQETPRSPTPTVEEIFSAYGPKVYTLARRMLGNDADAEDVAQDVLVQVVRKLPTFRGEADIGTWLHRVTVNAALDHRARRAQRQEHHADGPLEHFLEGGDEKPVRPWFVAPDQHVLNSERARLIEEAIARLPDHFRDVYVLADVEGLSNPDIADLLKLSVPAVKSRLHRARLLMRDHLARHFEEVPA